MMNVMQDYDESTEMMMLIDFTDKVIHQAAPLLFQSVSCGKRKIRPVRIMGTQQIQ